MKYALLALVATLGFSMSSFAQISSSAASYQGRGEINERGPRGGGGHGDWRREEERRQRGNVCTDRWGNRVPCDNRDLRPPRPRPPGGGGYYPPSQPSRGVEFIRCESNNHRYTECYFNSYSVRSVRLIDQRSSASCSQGYSYGIQRDRIWVSNGCRAIFEIIR